MPKNEYTKSPLRIQQLEIAGDDSDSGLDSDGNYGHISGHLRRRHIHSQNSFKSDVNSRNDTRNDGRASRTSRPTSVLSRLVNSSTPAFWTYIAGRNSVSSGSQRDISQR